MGRWTFGAVVAAAASAALLLLTGSDAFVQVQGPTSPTPSLSLRPSSGGGGSSSRKVPASRAQQRRASTVVKTWVDTKVRDRL